MPPPPYPQNFTNEDQLFHYILFLLLWQIWLYTRQHWQWWTNVPDSYTHMYISCIHSLLRLRGRCSWSVPMMRSWSTEGLLNTHINRPHRRPSTLTLQCWKLLWGRPIEQHWTGSPSGCGNYLWSQGSREVQYDVPLASTLPRHSPQQTPPHLCQRTTGGATTVQNALHGLPVKRKRELCEKLCSTNFFFWKKYINYAWECYRDTSTQYTNQRLALNLWS